MTKFYIETFEEELEKLILRHAEEFGISNDEIIGALEMQAMTLREMENS